VLKAVYCLINVVMILLSVFLGRRIYAVFGAIGVSLYLGYLAYDVFQDALMFSIVVVGHRPRRDRPRHLVFPQRQQKIAHWLVTSLPPENPAAAAGACHGWP